ncbi:MAG: NUDIX hydrolase [Anaerolineales bacterium]|jgi:8-oxo-dGTP pyrophosphatase MutT (NUDIX family)|nr:NUDIX hydrolase [Anaerolineales bacterium]
MVLTPWKILDSHYIHPRFRIDKVELVNGKVFEPVVFEFRSWANIVALTKDNEVVLVRQYRHGVREMLLELPGGVVDEGENPLEGARRELMEETGYSAGNMIEVGRIYPNPAIQHNTLFCYLATDVELTGSQHFDETEELEVHLVKLDELLQMVKRGEFKHALHVAVLFQALAHLERI